MPSLNLKVIMVTHFGQCHSQQFTPDDFANLHRQITDKLEELMRRVPVMRYPHNRNENATLTAEMTRSFHDTAELRRDLALALNKFSDMLQEIWGNHGLPCFLEEPEPPKDCLDLTSSWIFPLTDEVAYEIYNCKHELAHSGAELDGAFYFLEIDLGFEDLAQYGCFYEPCAKGTAQDNSELREYRYNELLGLCDRYAAAVQKMFDLATKARNDELETVAARKVACAAAHA